MKIIEGFLLAALLLAMLPTLAKAETGFGDLVIHCENGDIHIPEEEYDTYYSGYSREEFCTLFSPYISDFPTELRPDIDPSAPPFLPVAPGDDIPIAEADNGEMYEEHFISEDSVAVSEETDLLAEEYDAYYWY